LASYDFIMAGGGAAGLGLAYELSLSSLRGKRILIVDRDAKDRNDRTWCYWSDKTTRFDHLACHTWDRVQVINKEFHKTYDLHPYRYHMIRGIDFYQSMRESLSTVPGVSSIQARIQSIADTKDHTAAEVTVSQGETYQAKWVFDSTFNPSDYYSGNQNYHYLKQHFKGWEIETPTDTFDPTTVTLFDFRTPQNGCMRFFYVLPLSKRRALVEYTLFSANLIKGKEYDQAVADYLEKVLNIPKYRVDTTEAGVIPMTDQPFPRKLEKRVMAIGTKGGRVKSSSGYAFLRIQQDSRAIVKSLLDQGHPFDVPPGAGRYRLFDTIMLHVMHRNGDRMADIFTQMFQRNSITSIFRFLDEDSPLGENIRFLSTLPKTPFIKALLKVKLLRKV
jgi:lycopene beta-cyclase